MSKIINITVFAMTDRPSHLYCANPACSTTGNKTFETARASLSNILLPVSCFRIVKKIYFEHYCKRCRSTPASIPNRVCSSFRCPSAGAPQLAAKFGSAGNGGTLHSCVSCTRDPMSQLARYKEELRDAGITGPLNLGMPQTDEERAAQVPGMSRYCTNAGCPDRARWPLPLSAFNAGNPGCTIAFDIRCSRCKHFEYVMTAIATLEKPALSASTTQVCAVCEQTKLIEHFITVHAQAKEICKACDNESRRSIANANRNTAVASAVCAHIGGCSNPWRNMVFRANDRSMPLSRLTANYKHLENLEDFGYFLCDYHHEEELGRFNYITNTRLQLCNNEKIQRSECVDCRRTVNGDEYSPPCMFEFDHRPGTVKIGDVSTLVYQPLAANLALEMAKCDLRCKRCHIAVTQTRMRDNATSSECGKRPVAEITTGTSETQVALLSPPAKKARGPRCRATTGLGKGKRAPTPSGTKVKEHRLSKGSYSCLKCGGIHPTAQRTITGKYCPHCVNNSVQQARIYELATTSTTLYCASALCSRAKTALVAKTSFSSKATKTGRTIKPWCHECSRPYVPKSDTHRVCIRPTCSFGGARQENQEFVAQYHLKRAVDNAAKPQRVCNTCVNVQMILP
jgi:hypothetical protein